MRFVPLLALIAPPVQAGDLTTVVPASEVCYHEGRAFSPGAVIYVDLPRGCDREATRLLKMAETRVCERPEPGAAPVWLPLTDIPLDEVTKEIGPDCEW